MNAALGTLLIASTDVVTTTISVTGLSFQPTAVIFWWNGITSATDTVGRGTHRRGFGVAAGTSARWSVTSHADDAVAAAVTACAQSDLACVMTVNGIGSAADGKADFDAFLSDGFRLIVDDQFGASLRVAYLALDPTSAAVFTLTEPGAAGDVDVAGLAFQPEFALFASSNPAVLAESFNVDSRIMIGAAAASGQGVCTCGSNDAATTMQTGSYCTDAECIACFEGTVVSPAARASFVQFNADGLRVNYTERSASRLIHGLALAGNGQYAVGSGTTQTDTTTPITMPGSAGIDTVVAGIVVSHNRAESTSDTLQDHDESSMGAFTSASARLTVAVLDEDAVADSEVTTAVEYDAVYANISTASAIEGLMDVADMTAKTYIMVDADPSAFFFWNILFGTAGAPPAAVDTGGWDQLLSNRRNRLVRTG